MANTVGVKFSPERIPKGAGFLKAAEIAEKRKITPLSDSSELKFRVIFLELLALLQVVFVRLTQ